MDRYVHLSDRARWDVMGRFGYRFRRLVMVNSVVEIPQKPRKSCAPGRIRTSDTRFRKAG